MVVNTTFDDFNDEDISDWYGDAGSFSTTTTDAIEGTASLTSSSSSVAIKKDFSNAPIKTNELRFWYKQDDYSATTLLSSVVDNSGNRIIRIQGASGDLIVRNDGSTLVSSATNGEWYELRFFNIDYSAETFDFEVFNESGTQINSGSANFSNTGDGNGAFSWRLGDFTSGSDNYLDDIRYQGLGTNETAVIQTANGSSLTGSETSTTDETGTIQNSSGSPVTTSESSTADETSNVQTAAGLTVTSTEDSIANETANITAGTGSTLTSTETSIVSESANIAAATGSTLTSTEDVVFSAVNENASITTATGTSLTGSEHIGVIESVQPTTATGLTLTSSETFASLENATITSVNANPVTTSETSTADETANVTTATGSTLTAAITSIIDESAQITSAVGTTTSTAIEVIVDETAKITSASATAIIGLNLAEGFTLNVKNKAKKILNISNKAE